MCGLAGIISKEPTDFNVNHFNILGTLNDERGGDSCGIYIDGLLKYGIHEKALFRKFTRDVEYPTKASIALLHCRKASPGMIVNEQQAQPIVFSKDNKVEFVLMHNGTIENARILATQYCPEFDTLGKSDSQIMAYIMYTKGYEVLSEYRGTAVFIIVDYRQEEPTVMLFKGSSIYNEASCKSERPLYCTWDNGKFYFSSIYESIYCINKDLEIYTVPENELVVVDDENLLLHTRVNRNKLTREVKHHTPARTFVNNTVSYDPVHHIYTIGDAPADGEYNVYPSGYISATAYQPNDKYYFFAGRLLYNKECYELLESLTDLFPSINIPLETPELIDYLSFGCYSVNKKQEFFEVDDSFKYVPIENKIWATLFTATHKHTITNRFHVYSFIYPAEAINIFNDAIKEKKFDLNQVELDMYQYLYLYQAKFYENF